jgi:hypothetical protein
MGRTMNIICARLFLMVVMLSSVFAWGENENRLAKPPAASTGAPDLDFGTEEASDDPFYSQSGQGNDYQSWMYWSLGFTVAAGGMTYLLWDKEPPVRTVKTVEVFTDGSK